MKVCSYLEKLGIDYIIKKELVRGFDYYTKTIFEFPITNKGTVLDLSSATVKQIKFGKPKTGTLPAETVVKEAAFATDGTDGVLTYTTVAGDLDRKGIWKVQAYVEIPDWSGHSALGTFIVEDNL